MNFKFICLCCFVAITQFDNVISLRVLALLPYIGKSHYFMFKPYLFELGKRGHDVTILSHFPDNDTENVHHIDLREHGAIETEDILDMEVSFTAMLNTYQFLAESAIQCCKMLLESTELHEMIKKNEKFDVIVTEQFNSDCTLGIAYKLNAPVVGLSSSSLLPSLLGRLGISNNPSYFPFHFSNSGSKPTFFQKIGNIILDTIFKILFHFKQNTEQQLLANYYDDIPPLEQLGREVKFVLLNSYFTLTGTQLYPSNIIEVAGLHVQEPKTLPNDIKKFIDEADEGVIYVSFGSLVKSSTLPADKFKILETVFNKLPQRVIFKWDGDGRKWNSNKVLTRKWLPQNDILAHPKVKAFLSHAGMMGTVEAVNYGVPVVNIPILGDQPSNAAFIRERGFGVTVFYDELSEEKLLNAFKTVLEPSFRERAVEHSDMFRNRLSTPVDTAIYWTEFAAKHPSHNFTSPAAYVPLYRFLLLDVVAFFAFLSLTMYFAVRGVCNICCKTKAKTIRKETKKRR